MPVTLPEPSTLPDAALVLLHIPPDVISLNAVVEPPAHTTVVPVITAGFIGNGFTVAIVVAARLPQLLV